jgi:cobalt-zinc-cadmium resistance protein CzcA
MAIGGKAVTKFYEDERTFDVRLRFREEYRDDETKIGNILIPTQDGKHVPLKEIADISFITGPTFIYREGSSRYVGVGFSIRGRDLGSAIAEAQARVNAAIGANGAVPVETLRATSYQKQTLPVQTLRVQTLRATSLQLQPENKIVWAGEFESKERATKRLAVIVPAVLLLILFLLYMNFGTVKDTLIAAVAFPFAFIGGFLSLWATGTVFGISAGIGFTILFGVSATNSIILVGVIKSNLRAMRDLKQAISSAVKSRIRPVLMISLMGSMGLFPAALSQSMGSEIQKPLAIMSVGGMMISMVLSFWVLPQVFYFAYKRKYLREKKAKNILNNSKNA